MPRQHLNPGRGNIFIILENRKGCLVEEEVGLSFFPPFPSKAPEGRTRITEQKLTGRRFQVDYKKDSSNNQNGPVMEWAFSGRGLLPVPRGLLVWYVMVGNPTWGGAPRRSKEPTTFTQRCFPEHLPHLRELCRLLRRTTTSPRVVPTLVFYHRAEKTSWTHAAFNRQSKPKYQNTKCQGAGRKEAAQRWIWSWPGRKGWAVCSLSEHGVGG